jgi:hypothetical protein
MGHILIKAIPNQVINELASYGPFDLKQYIQVAEGAPKLHFRAELKDGQALPKGMICTSDGIVTGIPAKDTQGNYEVVITVESEEAPQQAIFMLAIKPSFANKETGYLDKLKSQVWAALEQRLPAPELKELLDRPISKLDVYYLLERWSMITIWDAFNLDPPEEKKLLALEGTSQHYYVYDRGSSLIGCPKDLFSHERTLEDGLQTARAMAREVYKRNWTIEMAGIDKLVRCVWVEAQHLGDIQGRPLEVINYQPSPEDIRLYAHEALKMEKGRPE